MTFPVSKTSTTSNWICKSVNHTRAKLWYDEPHKNQWTENAETEGAQTKRSPHVEHYTDKRSSHILFKFIIYDGCKRENLQKKVSTKEHIKCGSMEAIPYNPKFPDKQQGDHNTQKESQYSKRLTNTYSVIGNWCQHVQSL